MPDRDDQDDLDERENPDPSDTDPDYESAWAMNTVGCPYCRKQIAEEAEWCPHCGKYISKEDAPRSHKPIWILLGFVLVALIVLVWLV